MSASDDWTNRPGTFGAAIRRAVDTRDPALAGQIADRARDVGATYADLYGAVQRVTGIDAATWDALLEEADALDADARERAL